MSKGRSTGFSLVELLIVLVAIGILAALLFPVTASARDRAGQKICLDNLQILGLAVVSYVNDYDESLPIQWTSPRGNLQAPSSNFGWQFIVGPYLPRPDVWLCPDHPSADFEGGQPAGSYWVNAYLTGWCNDSSHNACGTTLCDAKPMALMAIPHVATTVLLTDGGGDGALLDPYNYCLAHSSVPRQCAGNARFNIHHGGNDTLFVDAHVSWIPSLSFKSTGLAGARLPVERASCSISYPANDGKNPWFKP